MSLFQKQATNSMNLPVASHIDKLSELIGEMSAQIETTEKDLHILRGQITELSFVNKDSDQELNEYLVESICSLRLRWQGEWDEQSAQMNDYKKKVAKVFEEQEDIDILRQELEQKVEAIENVVGIV